MSFVWLIGTEQVLCPEDAQENGLSAPGWYVQI